MNEFTLVMGAAMTAFMFIGIFCKGVLQWVFAFAVVILGFGICYQLAIMTTVPVYLLAAVAVVAVGYVCAIIAISVKNRA